MESLLAAQNLFSKEQYPPDDRNISQVPFEDIHAFLIQEFAQSGYQLTVTHAGQSGNENYVLVSLTFKLSNGSVVTIPGAAQGAISMPGLLATAVRNAVLRHLGAGTDLYKHAEGEEPQFVETKPSTVVESPFSNAPTFGKQYQGGPKKEYGPWDGTAKLKSGKNAGRMWKELPDDTIQFLAGNGNDLATKEAKRRLEAYSR